MLPNLNRVCFCFPFVFLPLVVVDSGSGSGGGEDGCVDCVEEPCPQAGCTGSDSPRMFLSDLLPEINSFGGLFDTVAVGNCGNADPDKEGGAAFFFDWGLLTDTGC